MDIYALQGTGRIGKSTTIQQLFNLIIQDFHFNLVKRKNSKRSKDFYAIFSYTSSDGSTKYLGLCSYGDNELTLLTPFIYFTEQKCDIILTACRTKGSSVNYLNSFSSKPTYIQLLALTSSNHIDLEPIYQTNIVSQKLYRIIFCQLP